MRCNDMMQDSHLKNLNETQLEAVQHLEGPILVLAGAGSGKTRVLTHRIANLVVRHRVNPHNILAVTFTNKATEEMRHRLSTLLGEESKHLWVATFHSAALRMLRRFAQHLSYSNDFVVYDEDDARNTMKGVLKELEIDDKRFPPQLFLKKIDQAKNNYLGPDEVKADEGGYENLLFRDVYDAYQKKLMQSNAMDFGDLLVNSVRLLETIPSVRRGYQESLRFILVDEYQDTNVVQYKFLRLLAEPRTNLLVVGDDDQSIYGFRGATIRNILEFEKDFPKTKVVKLEQNYRSTGNILEAANSVISKNKGRKGKKLWTAEGQGEPIKTYLGIDENEEAYFIGREIQAKIAAGMALSDIAIFYRTNAQSRALEQALMDLKIPYRIYGGLKFFERKEIKDILGYLRLILNSSDNQAFLRIVNTPARGIGAQSLQGIITQAAEESVSLLTSAGSIAQSNKQVRKFVELMEALRVFSEEASLSELVRKVIEMSEYGTRLESTKDITAVSRIENLKELEALARSFELQHMKPREALREFLDKVALTAGNDLPVEEEEDQKAAQKDKNYKPNVVSMMTLHLAKGLEFPVVFLTGLEEGLLPHYKCMFEEPLVEEERRLCYVGLTRAQKELYVTRAQRRGMFSGGDTSGMTGFFREASRFAFDIPTTLLNHCGQDFFSGVWDDVVYDEDDESLDENDEWDEKRHDDVPEEEPDRRKKDILKLVKPADRFSK